MTLMRLRSVGPRIVLSSAIPCLLARLDTIKDRKRDRRIALRKSTYCSRSARYSRLPRRPTATTNPAAAEMRFQLLIRLQQIAIGAESFDDPFGELFRVLKFCVCRNDFTPEFISFGALRLAHFVRLGDAQQVPQRRRIGDFQIRHRRQISMTNRMPFGASRFVSTEYLRHWRIA